jgi:hypothetical protein
MNRELRDTSGSFLSFGPHKLSILRSRQVYKTGFHTLDDKQKAMGQLQVCGINGKP